MVPGSHLLGCVLRTTLILLLGVQIGLASGNQLEVSVYCTAGDAQHYLNSAEGRQRVLTVLKPLQPSRLFLEGRRGDEYVAPEQLREIRQFFSTANIACSGGIATVPGERFGVRQTGGLSWLNWESPKVRADVSRFFTENAPVFDELIVDDFFCTGDISPESERARAGRSWAAYRQDLLVSLIKPLMTDPTREANPKARLIIKFPQWYDRFHMFGYDPPRMAAQFEEVWVGTEVRDPKTRRMGYVQPTEGYMNFRWLATIAGPKVKGAWFDHIECSAQNFLDQAYASVLAGARELTLFHLGDIVDGHPGDTLLAERLPELRELADRLQGKAPRGVAFYKPPGSDSNENLYLADYLGMIGLPILPTAEYPAQALVAFLPVQAAADAQLLEKMRRHLERGATIVVTPALLRQLGPVASRLAGVEMGAATKPATALEIKIDNRAVPLEVPLECDASLGLARCEVRVSAFVNSNSVPFLTRMRIGKGHLMVLNVRTFSEQDFREAGEWVLAPRPLGLPKIPQTLADEIRLSMLAPLDVQFQAPYGVALVLPGREACIYSFRDEKVQIEFKGRKSDLPAHGWIWVE